MAPTVQLLSLSAKNPTQGPSDLLPYLPCFRSYFTDLPKTIAEMELKVIRISLSDIDAVTGTIVKVRRLTWTLRV